VVHVELKQKFVHGANNVVRKCKSVFIPSISSYTH